MWCTLTITKAFKSVITIIQSKTSKLKFKTFLWCSNVNCQRHAHHYKKTPCLRSVDQEVLCRTLKKANHDIQWENVYLCICKFLSVGTYTELEFCWIKITFAFGHSMSTTVTNTAVEDHLALLLNISYCYYRFLDYL